VVFSVALVCFCSFISRRAIRLGLPPDAIQALAEQMRKAYGSICPLPVQFGCGCGKRAGDLGTSMRRALGCRRVIPRVGNTSCWRSSPH